MHGYKYRIKNTKVNPSFFVHVHITFTWITVWLPKVEHGRVKCLCFVRKRFSDAFFYLTTFNSRYCLQFQSSSLCLWCDVYLIHRPIYKRVTEYYSTQEQIEWCVCLCAQMLEAPLAHNSFHAPVFCLFNSPVQ